jgi:hypothetical protein
MKNIVKFIKEKYKILIPVMVSIVLLVTIFFLYKGYQYDNTRNKQEYKVFQYYSGVRIDYTAIVTYNLRDAIVNIEARDEKIKFSSVPIYYKDKSRVIFPKQMSIVFPLMEGAQFKLYQYSSYYNEESVHFIKNNTDLGNYEYFFLYDGKDLFFFPEETTLKINDKDYIELGAMSYARVVGGESLIYYDTTTDKAEVVNIKGKLVTVKGKYIDVNLNNKYFMSFDNMVLLVDTNKLNPVFKTIDK